MSKTGWSDSGRKAGSDHFGEGPKNADHIHAFHGSLYYFGSEADIARALEVDKMCGVNVGWFQDEMDHRGIVWSNGEPPGADDGTTKDSA